jgi:tetratricopeptide (TPR) repeat protein
MRSEIAAGRWPANLQRVVALAEAADERGDTASAIDLLRAASLHAPGDAQIFGALLELLLSADRSDEAATLARTGATSDDPWKRSAAHLTLARLALEEGRLEEAIASYLQALDGDVADREIADELFFVLAYSGQQNRFAAIAEELCRSHGLRESAQSPEECVAQAYQRSGQAPGAAKYLEPALAKAPQKPQVLVDLAAAKAAEGDLRGAERALRDRVALDPSEEGAWAELGLLFFRAGDLPGLLAVVAEAERSLGRHSSMLRHQQAKLMLAQGDGRGAAKALLDLRRANPDAWLDENLLRQAYAAVGAEP